MATSPDTKFRKCSIMTSTAVGDWHWRRLKCFLLSSKTVDAEDDEDHADNEDHDDDDCDDDDCDDDDDPDEEIRDDDENCNVN